MENNIRDKDIVGCCKGEVIENSYVDKCFKGISIDSRTIRPGELFIALKGKRFDGHNFIKDALSKGAAGVIFSKDNYVKKKYFSDSNGIFCFKVEDTLYCLGQIANIYRKKINPKVIAVTGSAGKTTTKNLLGKIFSCKFNTFKNAGTQNNLIGVPINILRTDSSCEMLVLELGTNRPGEIARLSEISCPDIGILINIGPSHLKYLKSIEGVKAEKLSLFNNINAGGYAIINSDFLDSSEVENKRIITFSINNESDFKAEELRSEDSGITFKVKGEKYFAPFTNKAYIYNVLVCIATASIFNIDIEYIKKIVSKNNIMSTGGRFNEISVGKKMIIDDSYNSNPLSVECALDEISEFKKYKRKIVVFGDMLELGKYSKEYHFNIGKLIADSNIDLLFLVGEFANVVQKGALSNNMDSRHIKIFKDLDQIYEKITAAKKGDRDLILIKGSRAMSMDKLVNRLKDNFQK